MPANLANHAEVLNVQTVSGNTDKTMATNEKAGQTFIKGVPVQLNAGVVQEWDGATVAHGILGVSLEDAHNLSADGAGAPGPFTGVGFPGAGLSFGKVPNEPSGLNIPRGAPFVTGYILYNEALTDNIFSAQFDNSAGAGVADWTPVQSDIGKVYGMTKDANGHWYVDKNKVAGNSVLIIRQLDPIDGSIANGRVWFQFLDSAISFGQ